MEKLVPRLRFPGFEGEWEMKKLDSLLEFKNGINASKEQYGKGVKFINVLDILNNEFLTSEKIVGMVDVSPETVQKSLVSYGDILFQRSSETRDDIGSACVYLDKDETATFGGFVIRGKKIGEYEPAFFNKLLKTDLSRNEMKSKSGGSTRYNIGQDILSSITLPFPILDEQSKIAHAFNSIDDKISQLKKKKSLLEQYKKGMMQKIFSQEIRFKDEDGEDFGEWQYLSLSDISTELRGNNKIPKNCPVLTISAGKGFLNQEERFSKVIAGNSLANYTLIKKGQMAYNRGASKKFRLGCIYELNNLEYALIPNVYFAFNIDSGNSRFYSHLFETGYANQQLKQFVSSSARIDGLLNINRKDFFSIAVPFPPIKEQTKIASFLSAIDKKIAHVDQQIGNMEVWKKGLLGEMFV
jgi:type I restriction enzyme S subunit